MNALSTLVLVLAPSLAPPLAPPQEAPKPAAQKPALNKLELRDAAAGRRELAEIRLLMEADRDYRGAKERLARLAEALSPRSDAESKELAAQVESLRLEVARALGEAAPAGDAVERAVDDALLRGDFAMLQQLGARAIPSIVSSIRAQPDTFTTESSQDPLYFLAEWDAAAADRVALELLEHEGFFWRKRLMRVLTEVQVEDQHALWAYDGDRPRWLGDGFARSAEKWAEDPDVGAQALRFLTRLAERKWVSSPLVGLLEDALRGADGERRRHAEVFVRRYPSVLGRERLEELLGEKDASMRTFAATVLASSFPESPALLALANDSAARVRGAVLDMLGGIASRRAWSAEEEAAFFALLRDEDESVAQGAWLALANLPVEQGHFAVPEARTFPGEQAVRVGVRSLRHPPSDAALRDLVARPARHGGLGALVELTQLLRPPLQFELLEALVRAGAPAEHAATRLEYGNTLADPAGALRVATALLELPELSDSARESVMDAVRAMERTPESLGAMLRWVLAREDAEQLAAALLNGGLSKKRVAAVDPELVPMVAERAYPMAPDAALEFFQLPEGQTAKGFRRVAADKSAPIPLRAAALRVAARGAVDDSVVAAAQSLASASGWAETQDDVAWLAFYDALGELPGAAVNETALQLVRDTDRSERLAALAAKRLDARAAGAKEIVAEVVARGFGRQEWREAMEAVLAAMGRNPELQDLEILSRAARSMHARIALETIRQLRDPRYLPLLTELVSQPNSTGHAIQATEALFGYLDPEAVEPLLVAAAQAPTPELRDRCLAQLEKIREYQDARKRWATRKVKAQTREQVIAELLEQLSSKSDDVRVQAIRALATWEAVEAMPRLIELSAAGSKAVAAAARAALDRLNEPRDEPRKE